MEIKEATIEGLLIIKPDVWGDSRGYFFESYNREQLSRLAPQIPDFVQDNQSLSSYGVLRGLHFQNPPHAQAKLVRVVEGAVWDVAVDLRPHSKSFGKYFSIELTGDNNLQLFIPEGFAHGFLVLSERALFSYKCSNYYNKESEGGIIWNDADIAIDWPIKESELIISAKDMLHPTFGTWKKERGL